MTGGMFDDGSTSKGLFQFKLNHPPKALALNQFEPMASTRAYHGAVLMTNLGKLGIKTDLIVVVGGGVRTGSSSSALSERDERMTMAMKQKMSSELEPTKKCELYDFSKSQWVPLPSLNQAKSHCALCQFASTGTVYSFGGWNGHASLSTIESLDIKSALDGEGRWKRVNLKTSLQPALSMAAVCIDESCIVLFGGLDRPGGIERQDCTLFHGSSDGESTTEPWRASLNMADTFGDGTYFVEHDQALFALSDTHFIHTLDFKKESWELQKL